jgi:hypothetical protein
VIRNAIIVRLLCCTLTASFSGDVSARTHAKRSTEVAVLHIENGRRIALPVLTIPGGDRRQLEDMEGRLDMFSDSIGLVVERCRNRVKTEVEKDSVQCVLPSALVGEHHYMAKVPTSWWDSRGDSYRVLGGRYFQHTPGSGIGFDLGPHRGKAKSPIVVLTSETRASFSDVQVVEPRVWRRWPELAQELAAWRKSEIKHCSEAASCVTNLASAARMRGAGLEYRLPDGRRLQLLRATSRPPGAASGTPQPFALAILWRIVAPDGTARVLRDDKEWLTGVTTASDDCASQCRWNWDARPEVFSLSGRTFVFGPYSGGTVEGYQFIEVLPQKLKLLGWYRWGS